MSGLPEQHPPDAAAIIGRRVEADGFGWQLYQSGAGPDVLLLHGTGSSAHTWKPLVPHLSGSCRLLMPDLPGHAGTEKPAGRRLTIATMTRGLVSLISAIDARPVFAIGHSAGAALLTQMALERSLTPRAIVSLNGAFVPFKGAASHVFGPLARLLAVAPLVTRMVSRRLANRRAVERLISQVGSSLEADQVDEYVTLLHSSPHIGAALEMMANWDLAGLYRRLPSLSVPLELVACERDRAVPAAQAEVLTERIPGTRIHRLADLGHLCHEEDPKRVSALLQRLAGEVQLRL